MKTFIIATVVGTVLVNGVSAIATPNVFRYWFTPTVVPDSFTGSVRLETEITGRPASVGFNYLGAIRPMRDDGSGGDLTAGDGVWTCLLTASEVLSQNTANRVHRPFMGTCNPTGGGAFNIFAEVWSSPVGMALPTKAGATFQETDYVVNYVATKAELINFDSLTWARRFYQTHGEKYDFLNFVHVAGVRGNRHHGGVKNDVLGIGLTIYDQTASFGSAGRLQGYNVFPISSFYDGGGPAFIHEIGHQWINFLSGTPFASGVPHWPIGNVAINVMGFSIPGSGAGGNYRYTFTSDGSGGYRVGSGLAANLITYNLMELYLMGLAAPAEVPAYFVLNNQNQTITVGQTLTAPEITQVTVNDLIAAKGARVPASVSAQKAFRCATIVLSEQLLDRYALSFYDYFTRRTESRLPLPYADGFAEGTSNPFYVATGGRAVMFTRIADHVPTMNISRLPNGDIRIGFTARMGIAYQLQSSVDLRTWVNEGALLPTPVVTPPIDPARNIVITPSPGSDRMFYRLQVMY